MIQEVGRIISRINLEGVTVILLERKARMALRLAHRAYILELEKILLQGNAQEPPDDKGLKRTYLGTA